MLLIKLCCAIIACLLIQNNAAYAALLTPGQIIAQKEAQVKKAAEAAAATQASLQSNAAPVNLGLEMQKKMAKSKGIMAIVTVSGDLAKGAEKWEKKEVVETNTGAYDYHVDSSAGEVSDEGIVVVGQRLHSNDGVVGDANELIVGDTAPQEDEYAASPDLDADQEMEEYAGQPSEYGEADNTDAQPTDEQAAGDGAPTE